MMSTFSKKMGTKQWLLSAVTLTHVTFVSLSCEVENCKIFVHRKHFVNEIFFHHLIFAVKILFVVICTHWNICWCMSSTFASANYFKVTCRSRKMNMKEIFIEILSTSNFCIITIKYPIYKNVFLKNIIRSYVFLMLKLIQRRFYFNDSDSRYFS